MLKHFRIYSSVQIGRQLFSYRQEDPSISPRQPQAPILTNYKIPTRVDVANKHTRLLQAV